MRPDCPVQSHRLIILEHRKIILLVPKLPLGNAIESEAPLQNIIVSFYETEFHTQVESQAGAWDSEILNVFCRDDAA